MAVSKTSRSENAESKRRHRHEELAVLPLQVTSGLAVGNLLIQPAPANQKQGNNKRRADTAVVEQDISHRPALCSREPLLLLLYLHFIYRIAILYSSQMNMISLDNISPCIVLP